jgi:integrase
MEFTARALDNLKAEGKAEEHFDGGKAGVKGLAIRVSPKGLRTWCFHYTFKKVRCRMDFGHYPDLKLTQARQRARAFRQALDAKPPIDPRSIKADAQAARAGDLETVDDLIAAYLGELRMRPKSLRTLPAIEWLLRRKVGAVIGAERLHGVTRRTLEKVTDQLRRDRRFHMAAKVHGRMSLMFEWGCNKGHLGDDPPNLQTERPEVSERKANARPLNPEETKAFWHGVAGVLPPRYRDALSRILKLSLLSGCRVGEVAEMDVAEIAGDVWTVPKERTKNGRAHLIPINVDMRAIIGEVEKGSPWPLIDGKTITGARVSSVFCKHDVPKALGADDYTAHSLRRTVATQMDEMGILESTIALCLNHSEGDSGKRNRVTALYVQPSAAVLHARELAKLALKREAFDLWAARLRDIIGGASL